MNFLRAQKHKFLDYTDFEFINHHRNRRKMKFNPDSDYVSRSVDEFVKTGGKITKLKSKWRDNE
jgi:hypothetical protein